MTGSIDELSDSDRQKVYHRLITLGDITDALESIKIASMNTVMEMEIWGTENETDLAVVRKRLGIESVVNR